MDLPLWIHTSDFHKMVVEIVCSSCKYKGIFSAVRSGLPVEAGISQSAKYLLSVLSAHCKLDVHSAAIMAQNKCGKSGTELLSVERN